MSDLEDLLDDILGGTAQQVGQAVGSPTWLALDRSGLLRVGLTEPLGGVGWSLRDAGTVVARCAEAGMTGPTAETLLVAAAYARQSGIARPAGLTAAAVPIDLAGIPQVHRRNGGYVLRGVVSRVAWAEDASALFICVRDANHVSAALLSRDTYDCRPRVADAAEMCDVLLDLELAEDQVKPLTASDDLRLMAALGRSLQMLGAQRACVHLTIDYVRQREQFGRPLSHHQVVRHMVARMTAELCATEAIVHSVLDRLDDANGAIDDATALSIAAARVQAARASTVIARIAHQLHGAMGTTQEYPLHHYTTRLWEWRDDYGSESEWAIEVARRSVHREGLWPTLANLEPQVGPTR